MIDELRKKLRIDYPVIDLHVHPYSKLGSYHASSPEAAAEQILAAADAFGIDSMAVFDIGDEAVADPDCAFMRKINDDLFRVCDCDRRRFMPFAYLNPAFPEESARELDRCISYGARGVKLWISRRMDHPRAIDLIRYISSRNLPLLQHCADNSSGNQVGETAPADAAECAKQLPEATIILAHLTNIGLRGIEIIKDCPNIIIECSGGDPLSGFVRQAIDRLGVERVVFGSDVPCRNFGSQLSKVVNENVSKSEQRQILCDNARRILAGD